MIKNKFVKNLSWIFAGNVVHGIFAFLLNIYVARQFTISDYGLINYSASLIAFFLAIGTLGFNGIITKKFAEDEKYASSYLGTAIKLRCLFSVTAIVVLQIIIRIINTSDSLLPIIVLCQSMSILFSSFDLFMYWFQYKHKAQIVAILRMVAFGISATWQVLVLVTSCNIIAYIVGVTLETALFGILMMIFYAKIYDRHFAFSKDKAISMLRISYPFICSAILVTIYGQADRIMLKALLDNAAVAQYSVSLTLAGAISIFPAALIEGFRPEIMQYKLNNEDIYKKRLRQLYASIFWLCIAYCCFITIFARHIILLLYGEKYIHAVTSLSLVVWYTSFSYFGGVNNLYMVAEGKTKWVQVTTLFGSLLNIGLNFLLIPCLGVVGSALASLLTQVFANFILIACIPSLRGCFILIIQGITLKNLFFNQKGSSH